MLLVIVIWLLIRMRSTTDHWSARIGRGRFAMGAGIRDEFINLLNRTEVNDGIAEGEEANERSETVSVNLE